jgi:hypothetical protein
VVPPVPNQQSNLLTQLLAPTQQVQQVRLQHQATFELQPGSFIDVFPPTRHGGRQDVSAVPRQSRTLDTVDVQTSLPHLVELVLLAGRTS